MRMLLCLLSFTILYSLISCTNDTLYTHYPEVDLHYRFHPTPLQWYDAIAKCDEDNAYLALPNNENEAKVLLKIFNEYPKADLNNVTFKDSFLLGFHDIFEESEFVTLSGKLLKNYYNKTSPSHKPDHDQNDCGAMHRSGELEEFSCNVPAVFFCQKYITTLKDNTAYKCPNELEKCYKIHFNAQKWTSARRICVEEGGHLAIIEDKKEFRYLLENISKPNTFHVGLHDLFKTDHITTVLGEKYENNGIVTLFSQNSNNKENNNCIGIETKYYNGYRRYPCTTPFYFICERPAPSNES